MHQVLANYTLPAVMNTLQPANANGLKKALSHANTAASGTTSTGGTTSTSSADGGLGTTFLNLLSTELQNQDPTAPVDSTAMVGQMISLNQLDQLISINQTLSSSSGAGATGTSGSATPTSSTALASSSSGSGLANLSPSAAAAASAVNQLPFDPNTLMPLNFGNAAASAASLNSSINASMGSSGANNNSGGK